MKVITCPKRLRQLTERRANLWFRETLTAFPSSPFKGWSAVRFPHGIEYYEEGQLGYAASLKRLEVDEEFFEQILAQVAMEEERKG